MFFNADLTDNTHSSASFINLFNLWTCGDRILINTPNELVLIIKRNKNYKNFHLLISILNNKIFNTKFNMNIHRRLGANSLNPLEFLIRCEGITINSPNMLRLVIKSGKKNKNILILSKICHFRSPRNQWIHRGHHEL